MPADRQASRCCSRTLRRWGLRGVDAFLFTAAEQAAPWRAADVIRRQQPVHEVLEASTTLRPMARAAAREASGIEGSPALLWVGRLNANKDPLTVLDGFERMIAPHPDASLTMVFGSDELLPHVQRELSASPALGRRVRLVGYVPPARLPAYYSAADIFVLGSHHEGSGYALIEACACGAVPVVTSIPAFRAITGNGARGALWPPGDDAGLAHALLEIASRDLARAACRRGAPFCRGSSVGRRSAAAPWTSMPRSVRAAGVRAESWRRGTLIVTLATSTLDASDPGGPARCGGGRLVGHDRVVESISIDSRTLTAGALFVALKGERVDGHDFAAAAAARGASASPGRARAADRMSRRSSCPDTLAALTACARARRRDFAGPVVAVTGSNGKTTTKEMIGAILTVCGPSPADEGQSEQPHRRAPHAAVACAPSTRTRLSRWARTIAARSRTDVDRRARHRYRHECGRRPPRRVWLAGRRRRGQGGAVRRAAARRRCGRQRRRSLRVALAFARRGPPDRHIRSRRCRLFRPQGRDRSLEHGVPRVEFDLVTPGGTVRIELALAGMHNLRNALGAAAAAQAAGASLDDVAAGLGAVRPVKGRLEFRPAVNGAVLVDDSYNANPGSLKAGPRRVSVVCRLALAGARRHDGTGNGGGRPAPRDWRLRAGVRSGAAPGRRAARPARRRRVRTRRRLVRERRRSRSPKRAAACVRTSPCWSRDRGPTGWNA